jgi:hypothetical protein
MTITRRHIAVVGADESTLQVIGSSSTFSGGQYDLLGDDQSIGEAWVYVTVSGSAVGSIDLKINHTRQRNVSYGKPNFDINVATINGTNQFCVGKFPANRLMQVDVRNNNGTSVAVLVAFELEKISP